MMYKPTIYYIYPIPKLISFRSIAEKHIKFLRNYYIVNIADEKIFPTLYATAYRIKHVPFIIHPIFYALGVYRNMYLEKFGRPERTIGIDVADSDHISKSGVDLANLLSALIVPSNFSKNAYLNSGVRIPVYVIPHGVEERWITSRRIYSPIFSSLMKLKEQWGMRIIQCWILHSDYRKGLDILINIFNLLIKERKDVALVLRRQHTTLIFTKPIASEGERLELQATHRIPLGWMAEDLKMSLFDTCDIYLLTSRGGGFEHPALEALSRREVVLGAKGGAWEDYLPDWALIESHRSGRVLPNNPIHDGCGVEMEVDKAVDKITDVLDNIDDYKNRVSDYVYTRVRRAFTWERITLKLKEIIDRYV